jgi:hypothetical protein
MTRIPQPSRDASAAEWNVYADALQEANDPRGELIALNLAVASGMAAADRDAYVAKHRQALFGAAADPDTFRVTAWIGCIPETVEIRIGPGDDAGQVLGSFFDSPLAADPRSIALVGVPANGKNVDLSGAIATLAERWPAGCRALALVDDRAARTTMLVSRDYEPDDNLVRFGDLSVVWSLPLEEIRIEVADAHQLQLGTIRAPALRSFALRNLRYGSTNDPCPVSSVLADATWPALRSFELRLPEEYGANIIDDGDAYVPSYSNDEDYEDRMDEAEYGEQYDYTDWSELAPVLQNLAKCPLERLSLTSFASAESLFEALGTAGLPATLVELDLSDSMIPSADWFLANKARFAGVKRLVLRHTALSESEAARLAELGPEIVHSSRAEPAYRYVVGSE